MTKIKTIKRRKAWPRWARWYAVNGWEWWKADVFATRPRMLSKCWHSDRWEDVRGPRLDADWTKTLRRITP